MLICNIMPFFLKAQTCETKKYIFLRTLIHFLFVPHRNDAAQSDDDDKSQAPLADTDGGKLKQKT